MIRKFEWSETTVSGVKRELRVDLDEVAYCEHAPGSIMRSTVILKSGLQIQMSHDAFDRLLVCLSRWEKHTCIDLDPAEVPESRW